MASSPNFSFLDRYDPLLLELAVNAERFCFSEPTVCLIRLRQLTEAMAFQVVAALGDFPTETQHRDLADAIRFLEAKSAMALDTAQVFITCARPATGPCMRTKAPAGTPCMPCASLSAPPFGFIAH